MGIPRFTSFVDNTFTGWQREEITGNLVIDGYSMCYNLYSFDWSHGGQFPEYKDKVAHFFISMSQSGITPIVVMDGIDYKEEKVQTVLRRRCEAVKTIHKHTANMQKRNIEAMDHVLPSLAISVFLLVMIDLKVKFIVADGEGDVWVYQLANMYSCPVLSSDSDFLMYKLKGGYIPFNRFHWEASPINAEVFYYRTFCEQFKFTDESLRLIIAAISGNDFLPAVDSSKLMTYISRKVVVETKGLNRLVNVVKYIQRFESLEDFVAQIETMMCLDIDEKKRLRDNCQEVLRMYDSDDVTTLEKMNRKTELLAFNSESLPEWVLKQFREGNFSCSVMEALVVGKSVLGIYVDNSSISSCVHTSLQIRQYMYGLTGSSLVTEYHRTGLEISGKGVHSLDAINGRSLPSLSRIPTLSPAVREELLYSLLGCDQLQLQGLDGHWKLVMAATLFWYRHTKPSPHLVKALLLSFMVCSTCPHELPKMRAEFFIPFTFRRSSKWMPPLHAFAQWQSTYTDVLSLNKLLMMSLEVISPAHLYDGKLAMFFALPENDDHLAGMLPIDHQLYANLLGILLPRQTVHHMPHPMHTHISQQMPHRAVPRAAASVPPPVAPHHQQQQHKRSNQPPRFQNSPRGHQARSTGQHRGGFVTDTNPRGRGRGHAGTGDAWGQRRSHSGEERGHESKNVSWQSHESPTSRSSAGVRSSAARGRSKAPVKGTVLPRAKIVVAKPPKFTHANRYAALVGDEEDSEENSSSSN